MHQLRTFVMVFAYTAGGFVCHQLPERSFHWGGWQFPVCARCTGLYASAVVGLAAWAVVRMRRGTRITLAPRVALLMLGLAALPTLISLSTAMAGGWDSGNAGRAWLAVPLGATAGMLVAAVVAKDLR